MNNYARNASKDFKWGKCHLAPNLNKDGKVYCNYYLKFMNPNDCFRIIYSSEPMKFYDQKDKLITINQLKIF